MRSVASARESKCFMGITRRVQWLAIVDYGPICAKLVHEPFCASASTDLGAYIWWDKNPTTTIREMAYVEMAKQGWVVILRRWLVNDDNNVFSIVQTIDITVDTMRVIQRLVGCGRFSSDLIEILRSPRIIMLQIIICGKSNRIWINGSW